MITSQRTFGVELEMGLVGDTDVHTAVRKLNQKAQELNWSIVDDASLKGFNYSLEARSPILKGEEGEKNFRAFCDYAKAIGFVTNQSCGTHVHLGGEDFSKREDLKEVSMPEFFENAFTKGYNQGVAFDIDAYELILNSSNEYFNEFVVQANNDEDFTLRCRLPNGLYSRLVRTRLYVEEFNRFINLVIKKSKLDKIMGDDKGDPGYEEETMVRLGKDIKIDDVIFLSRPIVENVHKLKNLFLFYTSFDSVLFSMLPKSRRVPNKYCKPLSYSYSIPKIEQIKTMGNLEKLWYSQKATSDLVEAKRDYKHPSRRHSVNLHSLLGGIGTVEVRLHDGSLDSKEILQWVELHQFILDSISRDRLQRDSCQIAAQTNDLETKLELMIQSIGIPKNLIDYIKHQIRTNK